MGTLKETGIISEVDYPKWLSNIVLVKNMCDLAWMCIAFIDVNDAFPKYFFPLPSIDINSLMPRLILS